MKALVFEGIGDINLKEVSEPKIVDSHDAIVRITSSAICGTDLHMIRGTMTGMEPGTILGHEGVGIIEEVGQGVRNLRPGDRVVIPSTIACGFCSYCRAGYFAQCDNANPNGPQAGTSFFGGPKMTGPFDGLQAEKARIPFANVGLYRIPENVTDNEAILLSDIFPTGYFGADLAEIKDGDIVAVFGCGPVGLFTIISAFLFGAARVIAIDRIESRLEKAQELGAEIINFEKENPVEIIMELTGGIGPDRVIDAVGVDAVRPKSGPASEQVSGKLHKFDEQVNTVAPKTKPEGSLWKPGDAPSLVLDWAVQSVAKAGTIAIIGVYPQTVDFFPFGMAMNKNLTIQAGNCNHRKYLPELMDLVQNGTVEPATILSHIVSFNSIVDAYKKFDQHEPGWLKVELTAEGQRSKGEDSD